MSRVSRHGDPGFLVLAAYFGGDQGVIGRTLTLNGNNSTVVGIMPSEFSLNKEVMPAVNAIQNADLLVPLPLSESARSNRGNEDFNIFARLSRASLIVQAEAEMDIIADRAIATISVLHSQSGWSVSESAHTTAKTQRRNAELVIQVELVKLPQQSKHVRRQGRCRLFSFRRSLARADFGVCHTRTERQKATGAAGACS
jgi:ribosomal protein S14